MNCNLDLLTDPPRTIIPTVVGASTFKASSPNTMGRPSIQRHNVHRRPRSIPSSTISRHMTHLVTKKTCPALSINWVMATTFPTQRVGPGINSLFWLGRRKCFTPRSLLIIKPAILLHPTTLTFRLLPLFPRFAQFTTTDQLLRNTTNPMHCFFDSG